MGALPVLHYGCLEVTIVYTNTHEEECGASWLYVLHECQHKHVE